MKQVRKIKYKFTIKLLEEESTSASAEQKTKINGVKVVLNPGETCKSNADKKYQVTWEIICDPKGKNGKLEVTNNSDLTSIINKPDKCEVTIKATSIHGCTLSNYYAVSAFIRANKIIFCIVFLVIGLFLNFLGSKIISITLFITAFFSTILSVFLIVFGMFGASKVSNGIMWVILSCSIILGVCVAYLFYKFRKAFYATLGGVTGYFVGLILYNFVFRHIQSHPAVVYWVVIVVCIGLGVLFAIFLQKHLIIIATSILGSYIIIKGASFIILGFPEEGQVIDLICRREFDQLSKVKELL